MSQFREAKDWKKVFIVKMNLLALPHCISYTYKKYISYVQHYIIYGFYIQYFPATKFEINKQMKLKTNQIWFTKISIHHYYSLVLLMHTLLLHTQLVNFFLPPHSLKDAVKPNDNSMHVQIPLFQYTTTKCCLLILCQFQ